MAAALCTSTDAAASVALNAHALVVWRPPQEGEFQVQFEKQFFAIPLCTLGDCGDFPDVDALIRWVLSEQATGMDQGRTADEFQLHLAQGAMILFSERDFTAELIAQIAKLDRPSFEMLPSGKRPRTLKTLPCTDYSTAGTGVEIAEPNSKQPSRLSKRACDGERKKPVQPVEARQAELLFNRHAHYKRYAVHKGEINGRATTWEPVAADDLVALDGEIVRLMVKGLAPGRKYEFRVQALGDGDARSPWTSANCLARTANDPDYSSDDGAATPTKRPRLPPSSPGTSYTARTPTRSTLPSKGTACPGCKRAKARRSKDAGADACDRCLRVGPCEQCDGVQTREQAAPTGVAPRAPPPPARPPQPPLAPPPPAATPPTAPAQPAVGLSLVDKMEKIKEILGLAGTMMAVATQAANELGLAVTGKNTAQLIEDVYDKLFLPK